MAPFLGGWEVDAFIKKEQYVDTYILTYTEGQLS